MSRSGSNFVHTFIAEERLELNPKIPGPILAIVAFLARRRALLAGRGALTGHDGRLDGDSGVKRRQESKKVSKIDEVESIGNVPGWLGVFCYEIVVGDVADGRVVVSAWVRDGLVGLGCHRGLRR